MTLRATKYKIEPIHCPSKCPPKICTEWTVGETGEVIYRVKDKLSEYSGQYLYNVKYFKACNNNPGEDFQTLSLYLDALERRYLTLYYGAEPCPITPKVQSLIEDTLDLTGTKSIETRVDLVIDTSGQEAWTLNNPYCVAYEDWESIMYIRCEPLIFEVETVEQLCSHVIKCDLSFDFNIFLTTLEECESRFDIVLANKSDEECLIQYQVLKKKIPDCTISFESFGALQKCGIDFTAIDKLWECGIQIDVNLDTGCPEITYDLLTIPVCSWVKSDS